MGQHQTKNLPHSKRYYQQSKKTTIEWGQIFATHISDKEFISKIYKEFIALNSQTNKHTQIIQLKMGKRREQTFL